MTATNPTRMIYLISILGEQQKYLEEYKFLAM
jgi:hypothetical protein